MIIIKTTMRIIMEVIIKIIMKINLLNISLHCHRSSVTWAMTSKSIVINISSMQCIRMIKFGISSGEGSTIRSVLVLACASGRTSGSPNSSQWRIQDLVILVSDLFLWRQYLKNGCFNDFQTVHDHVPWHHLAPQFFPLSSVIRDVIYDVIYQNAFLSISHQCNAFR